MQKPASILFVLLAGVVMFGGFAGQVDAAAGDIDLAVSPAVLNLRSAGGAVSMHTDVAYSSVSSAALTVDGNAVTQFYTFADARGEIVVRCDIELIKSIVECPSATFELVLSTADGPLSGVDTIGVINVGR